MAQQTVADSVLQAAVKAAGEDARREAAARRAMTEGSKATEQMRKETRRVMYSDRGAATLTAGPIGVAAEEGGGRRPANTRTTIDLGGRIAKGAGAAKAANVIDLGGRIKPSAAAPIGDRYSG